MSGRIFYSVIGFYHIFDQAECKSSDLFGKWLHDRLLQGSIQTTAAPDWPSGRGALPCTWTASLWSEPVGRGCWGDPVWKPKHRQTPVTAEHTRNPEGVGAPRPVCTWRRPWRNAGTRRASPRRPGASAHGSSCGLSSWSAAGRWGRSTASRPSGTAGGGWGGTRPGRPSRTPRTRGSSSPGWRWGWGRGSAGRQGHWLQQLFALQSLTFVAPVQFAVQHN